MNNHEKNILSVILLTAFWGHTIKDNLLQEEILLKVMLVRLIKYFPGSYFKQSDEV
jgi:hypothetical protein